MNKTHKRYVNKVLRRIDCSNSYKKRIRNDLHIMMEEKVLELNESDPYKLLGEPEQVAEEFAENMGVNLFAKYQNVSEKTILGTPVIQINNNNYRGYEYKSKKTIMGIPLVHINNKPLGVAKGIIACGCISIGIISLGGISIGVISFGGVSFALLLGIGGAAIAKEFAYGGYAKAKVAIGKEINAKVGFYSENGKGEFVRKIVEDTQLMKDYIYSKVPDLSSFVKGVMDKCMYFVDSLR